MADVSLVKLYSNECQWTLLMVNQHWFRQWLGAVRQQAISWANVDPDLRHHMASLGHNELTHRFWQCQSAIFQTFPNPCLTITKFLTSWLDWLLSEVALIAKIYFSNTFYMLWQQVHYYWKWIEVNYVILRILIIINGTHFVTVVTQLIHY